MNRRGESCEVKHRKRSVGKFPWAVKSAMPIPSSITCGTRFQCSTGTDLVKPGIAYLKIHTAPKTAPHAIPPLHQLPRPPRRRFVAVVHRIAPPDRFQRHEAVDQREENRHGPVQPLRLSLHRKPIAPGSGPNLEGSGR